MRRTIHQLGLLQIDYVNVLLPSHYMVPFSRLGPYSKALLNDLIYRRREFTEHWAHEASIVPMETWPLLGYRRETHRIRPYDFEPFMKRHAEFVTRVVEEVRARGPLSADELGVPDGVVRRQPGSWQSIPRVVLEAHFGRGVLAVADRRVNFARVFDLAERVIPPVHHGRHVPNDEAQRELLRLAARAHGVGTAHDLADYYRMPIGQARPRIAELVEAGALQPVRVEGWRETAYLHPDAKLPARIERTALLSPFDPVVWYRDRAARLFGFDYRIEIFFPEAKRKWGYYVLPFLLGDRLVARVDLKADRAKRRLLVLAAYGETHAKPEKIAEALAEELRTLAGWLGLDKIAVGKRGSLSQTLARTLR